MSTKLHISNELALPLDAVTQKLAFLGRTGSGKTYASMKLAEEMLQANAQIVSLDPVGVWYGLRLAANGKDAGLEIPVFGGLHGDIPLEATAGELIADVIVDRGISAVVDVSQMIQAEQQRFGKAFATRLFDRRKKTPSAMMLFLEEAQEFVPQNPMKGDEHMLHAFTRLCKIGRNFGIGVSIISQRPQEVNKKVLNMTECMFTFQMTGPQERKTIREWVSYVGDDVNIVDRLPLLKVGQAHVSSPQWLQISEDIHISEKSTYNASSTPKVGAKPIQVKPLKPMDLERIRSDMAETIERAKSEDPKELRKQIADLKKQLAAKVPVHAQRANQPASNERLKNEYERGAKAERKRIRSAIQSALVRAASKMHSAATHLNLEEYSEFNQALDILKTTAPVEAEPTRIVPTRPTALHSSPESRKTVHTERSIPDGMGQQNGFELRAGARRMLAVLAKWYPNAIHEGQLRAEAGLRKGGTFSTYLSNLRTAGMIVRQSDGKYACTEAGKDAIGDDAMEVPTTTEDVLGIWRGKLRGGALRMLTALIEHGPMTAEDLQEASRLSQGGTFSTYLSNLRTANLVVSESGMIAPNRETLLLD